MGVILGSCGGHVDPRDRRTGDVTLVAFVFVLNAIHIDIPYIYKHT